MPAPTGFTLITAAKIQDASGHLLAAGRVTFFPVSTPSGKPVSAIAGGGGGLITQSGVSFLVVGGAITTDLYSNPPQVADTTLTTPPNIGYRVTVTDSTGTPVQGPGYGVVQPSGAAWSLDSYVPVQPAQLTVQAGPQGPMGPSGPLQPIVDSVTGQLYTIISSNGALGLAAFGGVAKILQDTGTGVFYALTVANGALGVTQVSSAPNGVSTVVLIDAATAQLWQLAVAYGALSQTVVSSSGSPASSLALVDTVTSATWTLTVVNGARMLNS